MNQLIEKIKQLKVVPVITINHAEHGAPLAKVLVENGTYRAQKSLSAPQPRYKLSKTCALPTLSC